MKTILFDGTAMQGTSQAKFHGGSEYAKYIFRESLHNGYQFDVVVDKNRFLDENIYMILNSNFSGKVIWISSNDELYTLLNSGIYDRFFSAHPYNYYDYTGSECELWAVIHGIRGIELPWDRYKYLSYKSWIKRTSAWILGHSDSFVEYWRKKHIRQINRLLNVPNAHIITVSNHSKYSMLNYFPFLSNNDIDVVYSPFECIDIKAKKENIYGKYFLLVSGNRYEKNAWRAVLTFDRLFSHGKLSDCKVVITGASDMWKWGKINNKDKFIFLDYVSKEDLDSLYINAFVFVYPSLNEGFGYPPLYAMAAGVPVIASSSTSIPEVCSYAACYFSPTSTDDMSSRILWIYDSSELRDEFVKLGRRRVEELKKLQEKTIGSFLSKIFI
jgi:glycosyltransferase involved in cell wall biosynthesis